MRWRHLRIQRCKLSCSLADLSHACKFQVASWYGESGPSSQDGETRIWRLSWLSNCKVRKWLRISEDERQESRSLKGKQFVVARAGSPGKSAPDLCTVGPCWGLALQRYFALAQWLHCSWCVSLAFTDTDFCSSFFWMRTLGCIRWNAIEDHWCNEQA